MKHAKIILSLTMVFYAQVLFAQYYSYGQDPFSQKWRQLNTGNFKLIYPEKWENQIRELASLLEYIKEPLSTSLNSNPGKIPVILRNQTMLSNGFVMWAPKRMELITTIPYDNEATAWMKHLAVHEYRHVVQVEAANVSTTKFFSKIFGQSITGAVVGLHLPLWFLEGDAVLAETSFSKTGRGRLPSFYMPLTAQVLEKGIYSYDKATLGSYRDRVPNHYILGYHLVAATRNEYGVSPYQRAMKNVGATPFLPRSFSRGVKKETGKSLKKLYDSTFADLQQKWENNYRQLGVSAFQPIESQTKLDNTNYYSPHFLDEDNIIAIRTAPSDIPRLVKINLAGQEQVLFTPGYGYYSSLSYANGLAAWTEIKSDPRWAYRNYTNIRVFEVASGKNRLIPCRGRLQSPKLSPDGSKVAAIELDDTNRWALLILETDTGKELLRFNDPTIEFLTEPFWNSQGDAIMAVAFTEESGKTLVITKLADPGFKYLFHAGFVEISKATANRNMVWFTGTWSGRDELYAWSMNEQQLYSAVATPYGAKDCVLSADGTRAVFLNLTATGDKIALAPTDQLKRASEKSIPDNSLKLYEQAVISENFLTDRIQFPDTAFRTRKYSKLLNLFHFHSWVPVSLDVNGTTAKPGFTVLSQDILGSAQFSAGYEYEPTNRGNKIFADLLLKAFYPIIDFRFETGAEDRKYRTPDQGIITLRTDYNKITGAVSLPLGFNCHALIYGITPRVSTSQEFYGYTYNDKDYDRSLQSLSYRTNVYAYRRMTSRDLYPTFGFSAALQYMHTPFAGDNPSPKIDAGQLKTLEVSMFLPGLMRHHSLRFYAGIQNRVKSRTSFSDGIRFARGYVSTPTADLTTLSASYSLPLWYPDLSLGSIVYATRVKANIFYDFSHAPVDESPTSWSSLGLDLVVNAYLLRMPMPFELGIRTLYKTNERYVDLELISTVDFYAVGRMLGFGRRIVPVY